MCRIKHLKKDVPLMSQKKCDIRGEWLNGRREKMVCGVGLGG